MRKRSIHVLTTVLVLSLVGVSATTAAPPTSQQALLKAKLAKLQQARTVLLGQITDATTRRDALKALVNQPYTLCPNHHDFQTCTHTALKISFVKKKEGYLLLLAKAQLVLDNLNIQLQVLDGQISELQAYIAAAAAPPGGYSDG